MKDIIILVLALIFFTGSFIFCVKRAYRYGQAMKMFEANSAFSFAKSEASEEHNNKIIDTYAYIVGAVVSMISMYVLSMILYVLYFVGGKYP